MQFTTAWSWTAFLSALELHEIVLASSNTIQGRIHYGVQIILFNFILFNNLGCEAKDFKKSELNHCTT